MLKADTPFPASGSWALLDTDHGLQPVRLITVMGAVALVSLPRHLGASGETRVAIADLRDATALDAAECAELAALDAALPAHRPRTGARRQRDWDRMLALRTRAADADRLAELRRRLPPPPGAGDADPWRSPNSIADRFPAAGIFGEAA